jgi:hypothetical protein
MPPRYQLLERFAFSLVVLFALMCSAFIVWESSPDLRENVHQGKELLLKSSEYTFSCASMATEPCAGFPLD